MTTPSSSPKDLQAVETRVGLRIQAFRKQMGLTQQQFAKLVDMPYESYRVLERGKSLTLKNLHVVSTALGVTIPELFVEGAEQTREDMSLRFLLEELMLNYPELVAPSTKVIQALLDTFQGIKETQKPGGHSSTESNP